MLKNVQKMGKERKLIKAAEPPEPPEPPEHNLLLD